MRDRLTAAGVSVEVLVEEELLSEELERLQEQEESLEELDESERELAMLGLPIEEDAVTRRMRRGEAEDLLVLHKDLAYEVLWSVVRMLTQRLRETNDKLTFLSVTGKFE